MWAGSRIVRRRVDQGVADRLLDPVARVGAEPRPEPRVVFLGRADQAQVSFADQVVEAPSPGPA